MKFEQNKKYFIQSVYAFFTAVCVIIVYLIFSNIEDVGKSMATFFRVATPLIWGISLAYILNPLMEFFEKHFSKSKVIASKLRIRRILGITATYITFFILLTAFFSFVIPELSKSLSMLISNIATYISTAQNWITTESMDYFNKLALSQSDIDRLLAPIMDLLSRTDEFIGVAISYAFDTLFKATMSIKNIAMALIISIYLLLSKEMFLAQARKVIYAISNSPKSKSFLELCSRSNRIFSGFISGKILDSIIIGIICFVCLVIFNINYAVLISVIIGLTNVIPFFGPFIGAIPSIFLLLLVDPKQALFFAFFILILQQFDGNILGPKILGDATGLSSFWVIFAVVFAGGLFGIVGMFVGVPVFAVIYTIIKTFVEARLKSKDLSIDTKDYMRD